MNEIFKHNIKSIDLKSITQYAYSLKESGFGQIGRKSSVNGFQTEEIYETDSIVVPLFNYISDVIDLNCKEMVGRVELELGYYWININGKGSYNEKHNHMGTSPNSKKQSILSGVFYLNIPNGDSGNIIFSEKNGNEISIKPDNGDLLLFPPEMIHRVEPNNTNEERISIAFNYIRSKIQQIKNIV
jgi:hypothetical protein